MKKQFSITYKGITYKVSIDTIKNDLYVDGKYLCPFQYSGVEYKDTQLLDSITDCIGGWVEGYEIYSLSAYNQFPIGFSGKIKLGKIKNK